MVHPGYFTLSLDPFLVKAFEQNYVLKILLIYNFFLVVIDNG